MTETSNNSENISNILNIITYIIGGISSLLLILVIISFILTQKFKLFSFQLIMFLFLSTILSTISYFILLKPTNIDENLEKSSRCQVQGFLMLTFEMSEYIWGAIISINTNFALKDANSLRYEPKNIVKIIYLFFGYILPLIFNIILIRLNKIGSVGHWCYVANTENNRTFILIVLGILWGAFLINLIFCIKSIFILRSLSISPEFKDKIHQAAKNLLMYPGIQLIILFVCTSLELLLDVIIKEHSNVVDSIKSLLYCSQGIFLTLGFISIQRGGNCYIKEESNPISSSQSDNNIFDEKSGISDVDSGYCQ